MENRQRRFVSVGTRLAAGTTLWVAALAGLVYWGLTQLQWHGAVEGKAASARMVGALFREVVSAPLVFDDAKGVDEALHSLLANPEVLGVRVVRLDAAGAPGPAVAEQRRAGFAGALDGRWDPALEVLERGDTLLRRERVTDADGLPVAEAVVAYSLEQERLAYAELSRRILLTALLGAAVLIALLVGMARSFVIAPMRSLMATARGLEEGKRLHSGIERADEVGALAHALDSMATVVWEREAAIAQRNKDMKLVLDAMDQGLLLLDPAGVMGAQRSAALTRWFGEPPASGRFADWLDAHSPGFGPRFAVSFEQLVEGLMPLEVCVELLPRALEAGGRHFALGYQALTLPGTETLEHLLVVLSDVTAEVAGRAAAEEQRELIEIFQWLVKDRPGFASFLSEGGALVQRLAAGGQAPAVELREVHTLKGSAALLGVRSVAGLCHRLEARLAEEGGALSAAERSALAAAWAALRERVGALGGAGAAVVTVSEAELEDLLARLGRGAPPRELLALASSWRDEPVVNRLRLLADQARALSRRLERGEAQVAVETDGARVPHERFAPFWAAAAHVVRNAVDHGFETPAERQAAGKAPGPRLTLGCRRVGTALEVRVADDGRGVDWEALAAKARAAGLPAQSRDDLVEALCADGISSRDTATEISGRGVGMAAVRQAVRALGGSLSVESTRGQGTAFTFVLPLPGSSSLALAPDPRREVA